MTGTGDCTCAAGIYGVTCASKCSCVNGACNDGSQGNGQCTTCDSGYIGSDCDTPLAAVAVPAVAAAIGICIGIYLLIKCFSRRAKRAALLQNMDWKVRILLAAFLLQIKKLCATGKDTAFINCDTAALQSIVRC